MNLNYFKEIFRLISKKMNYLYKSLRAIIWKLLNLKTKLKRSKL